MDVDPITKNLIERLPLEVQKTLEESLLQAQDFPRLMNRAIGVIKKYPSYEKDFNQVRKNLYLNAAFDSLKFAESALEKNTSSLCTIEKKLQNVWIYFRLAYTPFLPERPYNTIPEEIKVHTQISRRHLFAKDRLESLHNSEYQSSLSQGFATA